MGFSFGSWVMPQKSIQRMSVDQDFESWFWWCPYQPWRALVGRNCKLFLPCQSQWLGNCGCLWVHACKRNQIALSSKCFTLPCDAAWAAVRKDVADWLHVCQRKHKEAWVSLYRPLTVWNWQLSKLVKNRLVRVI